MIAASAWLVLSEREVESELRAAGEFLNRLNPVGEAETRAQLRADLLDAQSRAELPLTIDAPGKLVNLLKRLEKLSLAANAGSEKIMEILVKAENPVPPPTPPSASFTSFRAVEYTITFTGAGTRGQTPVYSFQREYQGGFYPSELYNDVFKGQIFCGWKVAGAETPRIPGKITQIKVGEKRSGPVYESQQLPSFVIYRLRLVDHSGGRAMTLTAPKSERDRQAAKQSGFNFNEFWTGSIPTAEITITNPELSDQILTVKAGDQFTFLEKIYLVKSILPGKMELLDKETGQVVNWGRKRLNE